MEHSQQTSSSVPTFCELCLNIGVSKCGRCGSVYYCSRQHQIADWSVHKKVCKFISPLAVQSATLIHAPTNGKVEIVTYPSTSTENLNANFQLPDPWSQTSLPCNPPVAANAFLEPQALQEKPIDFQKWTDEEIFSSLGSELLSSDNNFWDIINSCDAQNLFGTGEDREKEKAIAKISQTLQENTPEYSDLVNQFTEADSSNLMECAPLQDICTTIVRDLNSYGICVLDKFVGPRLGSLILGEVKNLYQKGIFRKGELVAQNPYMAKESVRSDVTTWVNGTEPDCTFIGNLIRKLDLVVTTCNKVNNNSTLSKYKLHRRTKAMIACYPADGTYYKKHIDNPHKDGRCITCIYYLNKDWDIKQHGGMLRMFPTALDQIAIIEPIFDRMIFFWSDKRNPHEVLPSYATRFAITVWYFDADERDRALSKTREVLTGAITY